MRLLIKKGGVGKSTTVFNLGAGLAADGKRVLVIDVDPQGDLTKMLGKRQPHELDLTLTNFMFDVINGIEPENRFEKLGFFISVETRWGIYPFLACKRRKNIPDWKSPTLQRFR